jgi:hypothetical protein
MEKASVIRLKNFKWDDDTLLIISNRDSSTWLADNFQKLAIAANAGDASMTIGNGEPIGSPDGVEISVRVADGEADNRLEEHDRNKFFWALSRETALAFSGKVRRLIDGSGHNYLDPSNSPPAPVVMVSTGEYELAQLLRGGGRPRTK